MLQYNFVLKVYFKNVEKNIMRKFGLVDKGSDCGAQGHGLDVFSSKQY